MLREDGSVVEFTPFRFNGDPVFGGPTHGTQKLGALDIARSLNRGQLFRKSPASLVENRSTLK